MTGATAVAVAVSIVHYADNTINYDAYPQPTSGPAPSRGLVAVSWFGFTAFAVAGYGLLRRGPGLGHYTVAGATSMPWWRQAHIIADIACGVAVLAFSVWLVRRRPPLDARSHP